MLSGGGGALLLCAVALGTVVWWRQRKRGAARGALAMGPLRSGRASDIASGGSPRSPRGGGSSPRSPKGGAETENPLRVSRAATKLQALLQG